jgi:hypothetical protein
MSNENLFEKVSSFPVVCTIYFGFSITVLPSVIDAWQPFYNNTLSGDFTKAYFGKASVSFAETSETPAGGVQYKQKLTIVFPATDSNRALRMEQLHKVKYIKIELSTGKTILIGRNDYYQNARPAIKVESSEHLAQATFETISIFPTGFTPTKGLYGLPDGVPVGLTSD